MENTFVPVKTGKVREIYDNGDSLILVATDRISCFDVILNNSVTKKGIVLTKMSEFWFNMTGSIINNHMITTNTDKMPDFFKDPYFKGRTMMVKKLRMIPIECIVRGYITGSSLKSYNETGIVCGIKLPAGLKESEKFAEPIYTPSTKAEIGLHDENISFEESIDVIEKYFPSHGSEYATKIKDASIALYKKCADYAYSKGIIIADTKFEFGIDEEENVTVADEMLTPDSSRFWPLSEYKVGQPEPSFDKQFARDWLKANPDSNYTLPEDIVKKTISKYISCYEMLTGEKID